MEPPELPYAAPRSNVERQGQIRYFGNSTAKMSSPARLAPICVCCGRTEGLEQARCALSYVNPMILAWILLSPLALILAYVVTRKSLRLEYSACADCAARVRKWSRREMASWIGFAVVFVLAIALPKPTTYLLAPLAFLFFFALFCATQKNTGLKVTDWSGGYFTVTGVPRPSVAEQTAAS